LKDEEICLKNENSYPKILQIQKVHEKDSLASSLTAIFSNILNDNGF